jgi:hypothetical protein
MQCLVYFGTMIYNPFGMRKSDYLLDKFLLIEQPIKKIQYAPVELFIYQNI